jgi:CheY-like chemotaxis protein
MKQRERGAILIVEDDHKEQLLIERIFQELGVKEDVYAVDNGEEALNFVKGHGKYANRDEFPFPTFLMTDLRLPRMNGLELLLCLKRSRLIIIPTIVFTDSDDPEDIQQAYLMGANAYHVKSRDFNGLRDQVKMLHDYWMNADLPALDKAGHFLPTKREGKLGAKMRHPVVVGASEEPHLSGSQSTKSSG